MIFPRGRAHSIWFFRGPDARGWYVNLEEPQVFGERTISTRDHVLDIWVPLDDRRPAMEGRGRARGVDRRRPTTPPRRRIRAEGERVMRERPWPTGWEDFEPIRLAAAALFDGWDAPPDDTRALHSDRTSSQVRPSY